MYTSCASGHQGTTEPPGRCKSESWKCQIRNTVVRTVWQSAHAGRARSRTRALPGCRARDWVCKRPAKHTSGGEGLRGWVITPGLVWSLVVIEVGQGADLRLTGRYQSEQPTPIIEILKPVAFPELDGFSRKRGPVLLYSHPAPRPRPAAALSRDGQRVTTLGPRPPALSVRTRGVRGPIATCRVAIAGPKPASQTLALSR